MALIPSIAGSKIGSIPEHTPYWAVKLRGMGDLKERWICEADPNPSKLLNPNHYFYDWTLDLVSTNDILRVEQLWLFCPRNRISPQGNTATLSFTPADIGCAFHFNVGQQTMFGRIDHRIIGKVTDRRNGDCVCFIWDDELRALGAPWETNIYRFGTWRPGVPGKSGGVAPIPPLTHEVIGLRL